MDKVRVARLVKKYKDKESKPEYDPLLVLIKQWPKAKKYQGKAELVEPQVNEKINLCFLIRILVNHKENSIVLFQV